MSLSADSTFSSFSFPSGWIHEDVPSFDYGGAVVGEADETATLYVQHPPRVGTFHRALASLTTNSSMTRCTLHRYCKSEGVLAGVPFFNAIFAEVGCTVEWSAAEGDHIDPGAGGKSVHSHGPECVCTFVLVHRPSSALLSSHVAAPGNGGDPSDTQFTWCTLALSPPVVENADCYNLCSPQCRLCLPRLLLY